MHNFSNQKNPIVLFDGYCNLCSGVVQFIIKRDKNKIFRFAPLQSEFGKKILEDNNIAVQNISTFILVYKNKLYTKSTAALILAKLLRNGWQLCYVFIFIPRFIRDAVYTLIANNRYRWFGKKMVCWMPDNNILLK